MVVDVRKEHNGGEGCDHDVTMTTSTAPAKDLATTSPVSCLTASESAFMVSESCAAIWSTLMGTVVGNASDKFMLPEPLSYDDEQYESSTSVKRKGGKELEEETRQEPDDEMPADQTKSKETADDVEKEEEDLTEGTDRDSDTEVVSVHEGDDDDIIAARSTELGFSSTISEISTTNVVEAVSDLLKKMEKPIVETVSYAFSMLDPDQDDLLEDPILAARLEPQQHEDGDGSSSGKKKKKVDDTNSTGFVTAKDLHAKAAAAISSKAYFDDNQTNDVNNKKEKCECTACVVM